MAAVVTSFTTQQVFKYWDDRALDVDQVITSILKTLQQPFNIEFKNFDQLQLHMFRAAVKWWTDDTYQQHDFLRHLLIKPTIAAGQHERLISDPDRWHNLAAFGEKPAQGKSLVDTVIDKITEAVKDRVIGISQPVLTQIVNAMQSLPTSDRPNTVDLALSEIPAAIPVSARFWGVSPQAFMADSTMGRSWRMS